MRNPARGLLLGPLLKKCFSLLLPLSARAPRWDARSGWPCLSPGARRGHHRRHIAYPAEKRMELLLSLRRQVNGLPDEQALTRIAVEVASQQKDSDEKLLLQSLGSALTVLSQLSESDRETVRAIVSTITTGMEFDLRTFPDESSGRIVALQEFAELDHYTYMVAGCVGEFWTKMIYAHVPGTFYRPTRGALGAWHSLRQSAADDKCSARLQQGFAHRTLLPPSDDARSIRPDPARPPVAGNIPARTAALVRTRQQGPRPLP